MANWEKITDTMARDYGYGTKKGKCLLTVAALCYAAKQGLVRLDDNNLIEGPIPSCIGEFGTDFSVNGMRSRLHNLFTLFPDHVHVLLTHDLNAFTIKNIPALITEIRLDERLSE